MQNLRLEMPKGITVLGKSLSIGVHEEETSGIVGMWGTGEVQENRV